MWFVVMPAGILGFVHCLHQSYHWASGTANLHAVLKDLVSGSCCRKYMIYQVYKKISNNKTKNKAKVAGLRNQKGKERKEVNRCEERFFSIKSSQNMASSFYTVWINTSTIEILIVLQLFLYTSLSSSKHLQIQEVELTFLSYIVNIQWNAWLILILNKLIPQPFLILFF